MFKSDNTNNKIDSKPCKHPTRKIHIDLLVPSSQNWKHRNPLYNKQMQRALERPICTATK